MRATQLFTMMLLLAGACGPGAAEGDLGGGGDGSGSGGGSGSGSGCGDQVFVYAHSASTLYRVDPDTLAITMVDDFDTGDDITDIAIDKTGMMIGVSFGSVYRIDPTTAHCTLLSSSLSGNFNGLSFVPAAQIGQTGDDVLVGTRNSDGKVFRIDPTSGMATQIGDMGAGFSSSGDLVAVDGFGTMQTVSGGFGPDSLARLAQGSFAATAVGSTGVSEIWGVAFWKSKIYGFTNGGAFVLIDATTGAATSVSQMDIAWWGAAVTTLAPVLQ